MFAMVRQIPQATASMKAGKWEKKRFMGMELSSKTLGIVRHREYRETGRKEGDGPRNECHRCDPYLSEEIAKEIGIEKVDLKNLFARSDIITIHTPIMQRRGTSSIGYD